MIAYSRGSECLTGAASLKHRMPALVVFSRSIGHSSMVRATASGAVSCGFESRCLFKNRLINGSNTRQ
jgi:hypothetical protein